MNKFKFNKSEFFSGLLENILIIYVSFSMFIYGAFKYLQFGDQPYSDKIVGELTNMELMWAFYGRTMSFPIIIGLFEVLGAGLLVLRKTRIVGCFLLTGILVNIIIQDVIYDVLEGALLSASIYQIIILYVLWIHRIQVIKAFKDVSNISGKKPLLISILYFIIGLTISLYIKMTIGI